MTPEEDAKRQQATMQFIEEMIGGKVWINKAQTLGNILSIVSGYLSDNQAIGALLEAIETVSDGQPAAYEIRMQFERRGEEWGSRNPPRIPFPPGSISRMV
ncbi:MAG: hypothetical protein M3Q42_15370 [Pseudomonadota bacterium]|nr:hypothetical protein [Pseudomonadota bacterium]